MLDTGKLHAQTLALMGQIESRYSLKLNVYHPLPGAGEAFEHTHGAEAMYQSMELRKACCGIRKMEPLARALAGSKNLAHGPAARAVSSPRRGGICRSRRRRPRTKSTPWPAGPRATCGISLASTAIDYNVLHDQFFPSIGCAPCTRAVTLGEDFRSGRWWWENESAKECGLHAKDAASTLTHKEVAA